MAMRILPTTFVTALCLTLLVTTAQARERLGADDIDVNVIADSQGLLSEYPVKYKRRAYRAYVEAEKGRRYAIEVVNRTARRIGLVIAVDGRNVISGQRSFLRANERMYILDAYERAVYRGWRTKKNQVHRFYFTAAGDSYAAAWGDHSAMGVIAVAAFREKPRHKSHTIQPYNKLAPPTLDRRRSSAAESQAGTGFGEQAWSPARKVRFAPVSTPFAKHFLKYAWREQLCRRGIIDCQRPHYTRHYNRFWDNEGRDLGFAPHPPRRYRPWRERH